MTTPHPDPLLTQAKASYLCPLFAWVGQFVLVAVFSSFRSSGPNPVVGVVHAVAGAVEGVLILAGLILALKVVFTRRPERTDKATTAARTGLLLSGGTFALIAFLFLRDLFRA